MSFDGRLNKLELLFSVDVFRTFPKLTIIIHLQLTDLISNYCNFNNLNIKGTFENLLRFENFAHLINKQFKFYGLVKISIVDASLLHIKGTIIHLFHFLTRKKS